MFAFIRKILLQKLALFLSTMLLIFSVSSHYVLAKDITWDNSISEAEMAQLLAPIALYPDTLLTHILIASTYPVEVVEAERWQSNHRVVNKQQILDKVKNNHWDTSIFILLDFPYLLQKLSNEITWTQSLGQAFLADQARVIGSVQMLRKKANNAGSLNNINYIKVTNKRDVIIIEPTQPHTIYIPHYNTRKVYGRWYWSDYPPISWLIPNVVGLRSGWFYWSQGVQINHHYYGNTFYWHKRYLARTPGKHQYFNTPRKRVISHHAKRWNHHAKRWNHQVKRNNTFRHKRNKFYKKYENHVSADINRRSKSFLTAQYHGDINNKVMKFKHKLNKKNKDSSYKHKPSVQTTKYEANIRGAKNKKSNTFLRN